MTDLDEGAVRAPSAPNEPASEAAMDPYCESEGRMADEEVPMPKAPVAEQDREPKIASDSVSGPRHLTIVNRRGLHARASAKFVQTAEGFDAAIIVSREDMTVGGQSIMGLMMLAASLGTTITVSATGPERTQALDAIQRLVADRFGEEC